MLTLTFPDPLKDLANLLGFKDYNELADFAYSDPRKLWYHSFYIKKKNGQQRLIASPNKELKRIQRVLLKYFTTIYTPKSSTHGFTDNRSIVTNARKHLNKNIVFNIDLEDFFPSIHFYRVRNLLIAKPYSIPSNVATVIAQLCCNKGSIAQGAPTSPILSNMICAKMDKELQLLASSCYATYTRYADDITFSFTCRKSNVSKKIAINHDGIWTCGQLLTEIITRNGFNINQSKTRLKDKSQRLEVTGLTVNEFTNTNRNYIKQIRSLIYACEKFGYDNAEKTHLEIHYKKHRGSGKKPSLIDVIHGKMAFLQSVRGNDDSVYVSLAKRFNALNHPRLKKLHYRERPTRAQVLKSSLYCVEIQADIDNETYLHTGTIFHLMPYGWITCDHVLPDNAMLQHMKIYPQNSFKPLKNLHISAIKRDKHRDLALCSIVDDQGNAFNPSNSFETIGSSAVHGQVLHIAGFPSYDRGDPLNHLVTTVTRCYPKAGVYYFEVETQVRSGFSGGPVFNDQNEIVGVAAQGADKSGGKNAIISAKTLLEFLR